MKFLVYSVLAVVLGIVLSASTSFAQTPANTSTPNPTTTQTPQAPSTGFGM